MRSSFRVKLLCLFIAIILLTMIPIGVIIYDSVYNSMKKDASTASEKDMKHLDTEILNIIEQKKEDTKFLSTN
ncbi:MAG: hypothetical protein Q8930_17310, partial [Bacillota bacterium]|nr:hypothetical protein [Bacillota bacterium]